MNKEIQCYIKQNRRIHKPEFEQIKLRNDALIYTVAVPLQKLLKKSEIAIIWFSTLVVKLHFFPSDDCQMSIAGNSGIVLRSKR